MSDTWNYSDRAERAAARADAKRRKAFVPGLENDGEYIYVEWIRDNGEKVRGHFKLVGWGRAPKGRYSADVRSPGTRPRADPLSSSRGTR